MLRPAAAAPGVACPSTGWGHGGFPPRAYIACGAASSDRLRRLDHRLSLAPADGAAGGAGADLRDAPREPAIQRRGGLAGERHRLPIRCLPGPSALRGD